MYRRGVCVVRKIHEWDLILFSEGPSCEIMTAIEARQRTSPIVVSSFGEAASQRMAVVDRGVECLELVRPTPLMPLLGPGSFP